MKKFFCLWVYFYQFFSTFRCPRIRYGLLAILGFMCLYTRAQSPQKLGAAMPGFLPDSIAPLQIGDTIPEYLWHLPLQVANHPEGKEMITLGEYRGKPILLDFLSTGCGGCIKALPKIESVTRSAGGDIVVIPVTAEKRSRVAAFIPKNNFINDTKLPFIVADSVLKQHFPHTYISHVVWIDAYGIVRAATSTGQITSRTIREFQHGGPLDWPIKTENTRFFNAPLITLDAEANVLPNNAKRSLYYSAVIGYTEGVGPYVATESDSLMGIERVSFRNKAILDLYRIATNNRIAPTHVILEVADPAAYTAPTASNQHIAMDSWYQQYGKCYEATFPLGKTENWKARMLADLNHFLSLNGRIETRDTTCLVLTQVENAPDIAYREEHGERTSTLTTSNPVKILRGATLSSLVHVLNTAYRDKLVVDGTGYSEKVSLTLRLNDITDLRSLKKALSPYGLDLVEQQREETFLVITER
ncbi:Thiol-disulfide isomerase or thioredoxin [Parapedobacter composti]|uniref:Thiol-disulfide isomerase or thioredoxin n=2 Tax=Parapedobacter composti TaxID=623281 RepID=A0A1I1FXF0_9SPHI|nr:Thiol-disulfide isomerase or thioredoxin [Parapedobacter composti]